ncbi:MAG: sensor histidine kinase, partial [Saprospiraceae bacterium]|nr:sensor histidine kinase [Saprospiraceae bacterium]
MKKYSRLRMLSYAVILYLILAFTWWSVLLFIKNRDAFRAKAELLQLVTAAEGRYPTEEAFLQSPPYLALQDKYYRQEWMIL